MPLLEVVQTRQVSASIRLTDSTAMQVDQYAAFIHASADDVVEQALAYVFSKDRDFQDFLKTPQAKQATSTLRIRKGPVAEATEASPKKPTNMPQPAAQTPAVVASLKA
jgi:predicted transcriptional regulator